jgi:mono/diheme cytochrome c family protein
MRTTYKKTMQLLTAACFAALAFAACTTDPKDETPSGVADSLHVSGAQMRLVGDTVFRNNCSGCHGVYGEGGHGPLVANSSFVANNRRLIQVLVLRGNTGEPKTVDTLVVNGRVIVGGGMPAWHEILTNKEIASVLTYLRSVLNDSTVVSCTGGDESVCVKTARSAGDMAKDTVAVWEVKAIRDSLQLHGGFN